MAKTYWDYDFQGSLESTGALVEYTGSEAVANGIRAWFASFRGEVLRKPGVGGHLISNLLKPLSEERALIIRDQIVAGMKSEFTPRVLVSEARVTPVYDSDRYEIYVKGYCPAVKDTIEVNESINKIVI